MSELVSLGVDFGGTKVEAAVVARSLEPSEGGQFRVLARKRVATERERGYEAVLDTTLQVVRSTAREAGVDPKTIAIGVGMPGSLNSAGLVKNSNTLCLNGQPFGQHLERELGCKVLCENDANCFALAEAILGAGRGHEEGVVFGVIMGTGVGGGLVLRGRVWGGLHGLGGEWGHHAVGPWRRASAGGEPMRGAGLSERPACSCGKLGCLELYLSGSGTEREYQRRAGVACKLPEIVARRESDPHAKVIVDELLEAFGRGLANVIDILDPSVIVLGGVISNLELVYGEGRARVEAYVFNNELKTPILRYGLGDSSGVIGAALLDEWRAGAIV